jgi:hypothetical protein
MLIVVLNVALVGILVMGIIYIAKWRLTRAGKTIFLSVGVVLSVIRVASLWFLQFREWTTTQSISYLPPVLLLFPEAL